MYFCLLLKEGMTPSKKLESCPFVRRSSSKHAAHYVIGACLVSNHGLLEKCMHPTPLTSHHALLSSFQSSLRCSFKLMCTVRICTVYIIEFHLKGLWYNMSHLRSYNETHSPISNLVSKQNLKKQVRAPQELGQTPLVDQIRFKISYSAIR
jgi:hypothetical protein